jgi:anti-sigma B factor antagonist
MKIEVSREESAVVVNPLEARLEALPSSEFNEELTRLVDAGEHQIVLDLGHVDFIDSSAFGAVASLVERLGSRGGWSSVARGIRCSSYSS